MSIPVLVAVGLLGGAGSVARLWLDGAVSASAGAFPLGTMVVNVSGSFVLGLLAGLGVGSDADRLVGMGLIGGFTTFSTWMFESHRLAEDRQGRLSAINLAVSLAVGLLAAWAGSKLGGAL
jgi:fluoride exporter